MFPAFVHTAAVLTSQFVKNMCATLSFRCTCFVSFLYWVSRVQEMFAAQVKSERLYVTVSENLVYTAMLAEKNQKNFVFCK